MSEIRTRETLSRFIRAAGNALALAVALSACGGGDSKFFTSSPAPLRAAAASLPFSSDFEAGMTDWVNWSNSQVVDGAGASGSLRALRVGAAAGGAAHDVAGIVPGATYQLSAQVKVSDPTETVYIGIKILDPLDSTVAQQIVPVSSTAYSLTTVKVAAPANAVRAVVFVWKNAGSGFGFVDDVVLARADASTAPAPGSNPANLLSNPDFEAGMTDWANWSNSQVLDGTGPSGSRALRVGSAAGGAAHDVGGIVSGATYQLSAQVKVSDPSETVYIGIKILDPAGSTLAQQLVPVSSTAYSLATVKAAAPANAIKATVFVWKNAGSGFAFVDDVVLAPADASTAPSLGANLVSNAGFESGLADWGNWGNSTAVTGQSSSGLFALRVGSGAGGVGHDIAVITPGKTYSLSGQVKVSDGSEVVYLGMKFMDTLGSTLLEQAVPVSSVAYSTARLDLVAPANAAKALVYIWKNAGSGFAYADDIALAATVAGAAATKGVFIGNSISLIIANPSIGWDHSSGMAASSAATDYAHLVSASLHLQSQTITNFSALEINPAANKGGIPEQTSGIDGATAVTIELGDNARLDHLPEFADAYNALLDAASHGRSLVCVSTWWEERLKDAIIKPACEAHGGTYVYIGDLIGDPANRDLLDGPQYANAALQAHPHDWSMARIAARVAAAHAR
ncbi:MAG TPA: carbohydrate binding domain-containing protein [Ramlibacter sp.]|nr:carbohydrate binding domain-containing protein [Ramlibacter sp.]